MLLPTNYDKVNAAWLTAALSVQTPGVVVEAAEHLNVIHGSASKIHLRLKYRSGTQGRLPDTMWLKIGFEPHSGYVDDLDFYRTEALFYGEVRPRCDILAPESYFQGVQENPRQVGILMEDLTLRNARFGLATAPFTPAEAAAGLRTLAAIHAATWGDDRQVNVAGLKKVLSWGMSIHLATYLDPKTAHALFSAARGFAVPVALHDQARMKAAFGAYCGVVQKTPHCLVHGDAHVGNTFVLPDGQVGFVDWQTAAVGHWAHDVSYFLVGALDLPDRRAVERDLVKGYVDALREFGVARPPSHEEAWEDYRRAIFYGFLVWLGNPDEMQLPEINLACFARFGSAMIDHDVYGLLGV